MNKNTIKEIDSALKLHINYTGYSSGAPAQKISSLLDDYFEAVNVKNLAESIKRLKDLENA